MNKEQCEHYFESDGTTCLYCGYTASELMAAQPQRCEQQGCLCPDPISDKGVWDLTNQDLQNTKQRELSALAAIEKHNNSLYVRSGFGAKIDIDLSLLHEHDAEVRKSLVDALEKLRDGEFETPNGNAYTGCSPETEIVIVGICNDALAKVKDSK